MVRIFSYLSFSLLLTISLSNQVNAAQSEGCPGPSQVEKALNEHRKDPKSLIPLDEFKVEVAEATTIGNNYILLSTGNNERVRKELADSPLENLKPLYAGPLDATDQEVRGILKHKAGMLEKDKSVCSYLGNIGQDDVPIYIGKPKKVRSK